MKKTVILKERDLVNIAKRIIREQGVDPFPEKRTPDVEYNEFGATPTQILVGKKNVYRSLNMAIKSIRELISLSGLNPETNNLVDDLEKVKTRFNDLFGVARSKVKKQ